MTVAEALDAEVVDLVQELGPAGGGGDIWKQRIFLPLSEGGLGLQSMAQMTEGALAASWQANLQKVKDRLAFESAAEMIASSPWLITVWEECAAGFQEWTRRQERSTRRQ